MSNRICSAEDCDKPPHARGLCQKHSARRRAELHPPRLTEPSGFGERWLPVPRYEGSYEVSDLGRVRSIDRILLMRCPEGIRPVPRRGKVLNVNVGQYGYRMIDLWANHKAWRTQAHTLVLRAFVGEPTVGQECRHLNGDRLDNRLLNLCWGTSSENSYDQVRHGTNHLAAQTHCSRNHLLVAPNLRTDTRLVEKGHRGCRACNCAKSYVQRARKRGVEPDFQIISDRYYAEIMRNAA